MAHASSFVGNKVPISKSDRQAPAYFTISAWFVPALMLGHFALLAAVPVALVAFGAFNDRRIRALRRWAGVLVFFYATPLFWWIARSDRAESLSKDIHPLFVVLITAVAMVLIAKIYRSHRRQ